MHSRQPQATNLRAPARLAAAHAQRGMTLLEIMIVLAILGLVVGVVIVPNLLDKFEDSKADLTRIEVNKLANETYAEWSIKHKRGCPTIDQLAEIAGKKSLEDKWGQAYQVHCGDNKPPGRVRFGISSIGADGQRDTEDDIKSWEDPAH